MTRTLLIAALMVAGAGWRPARAQQTVLAPVTPAEAGLDAAALAEVTELLRSYVADRKIAGAVAAVARNGKLAYLETVGVQDLESGRPMTDRSIFRIYSMAKTVTAIGTMMLYEEGKFQLDDPVEKYLPSFARVRVATDDGGLRAPSRPITVRDLLTHTSGLSHRTAELYRELGVRNRNQTLTRFVENIVDAPLMEDPGTRYRYSESSTVVGRLIEVWSGEPLDVFLERRIFAPLGMVDTGFWVEPDARNRFVEVYGPGSDGGIQPVRIEEVGFTEKPALLEGAVGLVSTVPDFLRFSQMLADGGRLGEVRLLRPETVAMIVRNELSPEITEARRAGWGLGNVSVDLATGEYGWDGSAGSIFWVNPRTGAVILLMAQTSPAFPDGLRQRFKSAVDASILN